MANPWDNDPIQKPSTATNASAPWENDHIVKAAPTPAPPQTKEQEQAALKAKYPLPTGESVTAGMNKLMDLPQKIGDTVFNATGSPALATIAKTASTLIGPGTERAGVKGVEEVNNWVRTMGPKATSEALKSIANKDSTQAGRDLYDLADSIKSMTRKQVIDKLATLDPETRNHIIQQMSGTFKSAGKGAIKGAIKGAASPSKALHFLTNKLIDEIDPNVDKTVKQYASWAINIAGQGAAVLHSPAIVGGGAAVGSIIGAAKALIGKMAIKSQLNNEEIQKAYEVLDKAAKDAEESAAKKAKSDLATQKVRQSIASKKTLDSAAEMPQHTMESGVPKDYTKQVEMKDAALKENAVFSAAKTNEQIIKEETDAFNLFKKSRKLDPKIKEVYESKIEKVVGKDTLERWKKQDAEGAFKNTSTPTSEEDSQKMLDVRATRKGAAGDAARKELEQKRILEEIRSRNRSRN